MGIETAIAIAGAVAATATAATGVASALKKPDAPPAPPVPATDEALTGQVRAAEADRKRRAGMASGQNSTILTSPLGAEDENTATPSLLGS